MQRRDIAQWVTKHVRQADIAPHVRPKILRQLREYFAGTRRSFRLAATTRGTAFERCVWEELKHVPFGTTVTYGELARRIGHPRAARAVGTALKRNPLPVIVPCHRVIPAAGGMGEFAGGRKRKRWLLQFESTGR